MSGTINNNGLRFEGQVSYGMAKDRRLLDPSYVKKIDTQPGIVGPDLQLQAAPTKVLYGIDKKLADALASRAFSGIRTVNRLANTQLTDIQSSPEWGLLSSKQQKAIEKVWNGLQLCKPLTTPL